MEKNKLFITNSSKDDSFKKVKEYYVDNEFKEYDEDDALFEGKPEIKLEDSVISQLLLSHMLY